MDCYIDWNCHLLCGAHEFMTDTKDAVTALSYLSTEHHVCTFSLMPHFHSSHESVAQFLLRRDRAIQQIVEQFSDAGFSVPIRLMAGASVQLEPEVHLTERLSKLLIGFNGSTYLPIFLPISDFEDWIDFEINRLLYRAGFKLMFLSFDLACMFYPSENIDKFMRIPNSVFQFNYRSLENPSIREIISKLIRSNSVVLLGTSLDREEKIYRYDLPYYLKMAEENFSSAEYAILMKYNQKLPQKHSKLIRLGSNL